MLCFKNNVKKTNNNTEEIQETKKRPVTEEEKMQIIKNIQARELVSENYKKAYEYLSTYINRKNIDLEEKLFSIVGSFGVEKELIRKDSTFIKKKRFERLDKLYSFMGSLTKEEINSNLFLDFVSKVLSYSFDDCNQLLNMLQIKAYTEFLKGDKKSQIDIKMPLFALDNKKVDLLPISPIVILKDDNESEVINALDDNHLYVYENYNTIKKKLLDLADDIYRLRLNELALCYQFEINCRYSDIKVDDPLNFIAADFIVRDLRKDNEKNNPKVLDGMLLEPVRKLEDNKMQKSLDDEIEEIIRLEKIKK